MPYVIWSDDETVKLIDIIQELDCLNILDGKRQRNADVFSQVAERMGEGKTMVVCRTKFKKLKERYKQENSASSKSGEHLSFCRVSC